MGQAEGTHSGGRRSQKIEEKYFLQKVKLGQGSFGTVWRAVDRTNDRIVAVKQLDKAAMPKRGVSRKDIEREVELMKAVRHDNVTQLFDYYEDEKSIYLALEYCDGGDFGDKVKERGMDLQENDAADWMYQICSAILALHQRGIVHRDIKPDNFMVSGSVLKLSDFGLACFLSREKLLTDKCGTPAFMAPEQVRLGSGGSRGYSFPCDLWAAGIAMYMLMFGGRHPFITSTNQLDEQMLLQGRLDFRYERKAAVGGFFGGLLNGQNPTLRFSDSARRICQRMVEPKESARITARDALKDPWLAQVQRHTERKATVDPSRMADALKPSNAGYPQQAQKDVKVAQQEAMEKDRRIKSLEQKVNGLQDALQQQSNPGHPQAAAPPPMLHHVDARPVGALRPGLRCRYYSNSYGWMLGTVQSINNSDGTFNLDIRQHADPQNIAPPDRPEAECDYWPNGTAVFYQSSSYSSYAQGLPAQITGFNAFDATYNLDIRDHAAIDRIRARLGEPIQQESPYAGMRTEQVQQGAEYEYGVSAQPVPVQAHPVRGGSSQARLADGSKCMMLNRDGHLEIAIVEGFSQSDGCYYLLVDPTITRRQEKVRSEHIRAPQNPADAWPNGTQVMYESTSMDTWIPGAIVSFNVANCTYNLDVREGAPPERVRPR